jgi:F-type H+-transporting ATPase subunit delta
MDSLDWITVARPYAKAVFETAIEAGGKAVTEWSDILAKLADAASQPEVLFFIKRPDILPKELTTVFSLVLNKKDDNAERFIQLLAQTKRLGALPAIHTLYEQLRAEYEKTVEANVTAFEPLTEKQQAELIAALKKRLKRDIHLTTRVDKSLLGGAVVEADGLVMDGSLRGKVHRLTEEMMS